MKGNTDINLFKKRVCIVEDNTTIRQAYTMLINGVDRYTVIGNYESCEAAIKNLKTDRPDIVLMDLELPGMSGIKGIRKIKDIFPHIDILVISVYSDTNLVYDSLCAGASGYITKSTNYLELINAVDQLVAGGAPMSSKIARMVVESFQRNPSSPLSKRETEVLMLLSRGKSYTSIAKDLSISKETVKTHLKKIYHKLHVNSKSAAVAKALNEKYI